MSGFFGIASKEDCVTELFYGVDYHSHLGTLCRQSVKPKMAWLSAL